VTAGPARPAAGASRPPGDLAVLFLGSLALVSLLHVRFYPFDVADDAYIHFRIVRAMVATGLPEFNPGEAVAATSSPLWTLLLAALAPLPGGIQVHAFVLTAVSLAGSAVLAAALLGEFGVGRPLALAYGAVVFVPLYLSALALMETPLAVALALAGLLLFVRRQAAWAVVMGLAVGARLEFALLVALAWMVDPVPPRVRIRNALLIAVAVLWIPVFYIGFFGNPIPNTVLAKAIVYRPTAPEIASWLLEGMEQSSLPVRALGLAGLVLLAVALWRGRGSPTADPPARRALLLLGGFPVLLAAVYFLDRAEIFFWYLPLVYVPLLLAAAALTGAGARPGLAALTPLVLILPAFPHAAVDIVAAIIDPFRFSALGGGARTQRYIEIGRMLSAEKPDGVLMSSEIGGLGWGYSGIVADGAGLVSPAALKYHPMKVPEDRRDGIWAAIPPGFVAELRPDFIVTYPILAERLLGDPVLSTYRCDPVAPIPAALAPHLPADAIFGDTALIVCRRAKE
jgi:hypothetical protein